MRTIPREVSRRETRDDPVEATRRLLSDSNESELMMYILGALHDATYSTRHKTYRFSQSSERWLQLLRIIFQKLDRKSWIYKEGKSRSVWVLETSTKLDVERQPVSDNDKIAYVRGYFDTEGGMPKKNDQNLYFQFCQKGKDDLSNVRNWLHEL